MAAAVYPIPFLLVDREKGAPISDVRSVTVEVRFDESPWRRGVGELSTDGRLLYYKPSRSELAGVRQLAIMLFTTEVASVQTLLLPFRGLELPLEPDLT